MEHESVVTSVSSFKIIGQFSSHWSGISVDIEIVTS